MSRTIYLRTKDRGIIEMHETPYPQEDLFQRLLVEAAELLPGDQINPDAPRRWLLVAREVAVPGTGAGGHLSLDHLFLDQDGVPTFVEVKRSSDTRLRREVVGQMLDYAANAIVYWPVGFIRERFYAWCDTYNLDAAEQLDAVLEGEMTEDRFWEAVHTNLLAGKVRLLFVADIIPPELQRIIEFLNERMDPTEVLGVEIRRYADEREEMETFIPSVVGWTAEAQAAKGAASHGGREWDAESFFEALTEEIGPEEVRLAQRIFDWVGKREIGMWWGSGQRGSMIPGLYHNDRWHSTLYVWTNGYLEFPFQRIAGQPPFDDDALRLEFLRRLNAIPGVDLAEEMIDRRPKVEMQLFLDDAAQSQLFDALDWLIDTIRAS